MVGTLVYGKVHVEPRFALFLCSQPEFSFRREPAVRETSYQWWRCRWLGFNVGLVWDGDRRWRASITRPCGGFSIAFFDCQKASPPDMFVPEFKPWFVDQLFVDLCRPAGVVFRPAEEGMVPHLPPSLRALVEGKALAAAG